MRAEAAAGTGCGRRTKRTPLDQKGGEIARRVGADEMAARVEVLALAPEQVRHPKVE
eukprot:SAG11_NODE_3881_length_2170_cov_5.197489_2_plen_57_part_00